MSQSTNTNVKNFCDVCNLYFETKKGLYRHQSYDLKHKELLEKNFESEEEKSRRGCIIRMKMIILLKTICTLKLGMNVENAMNNLGIK